MILIFGFCLIIQDRLVDVTIDENSALLPFFAAITMIHNIKMMLMTQYSHFLETEIALLADLFDHFMKRLVLM
jgi:hypothetical protein